MLADAQHLAVVLLAGFVGAFFTRSIAETLLEQRQADSMKALWLAEAGVANIKSLSYIPTTTTNGSLPDDAHPANTYTFSVTPPASIGSGCYTFDSTGTVTSPGSTVTKVITATLRIPDASKIGYSVETTSNELCFGNANNCNKTASNYLTNNENGQLAKTSSSKTFESFFGVSMAEMKAWAQSSPSNLYYSSATPPDNEIAAKGVTWVDVPSGQELSIQHLNNLVSSSPSIVIINGNFSLNGVAGGGGSTFKGILYVIGAYTMSGNASIAGTTFIESAATIKDDFTGSSSVAYNSTYIAQSLALAKKTIVSWKEN